MDYDNASSNALHYNNRRIGIFRKLMTVMFALFIMFVISFSLGLTLNSNIAIAILILLVAFQILFGILDLHYRNPKSAANPV
ncbi:MAG: hypothetical protein QXV17_02570 [Candidatus Micrarchaeaceae archaeon]